MPLEAAEPLRPLEAAESLLPLQAADKIHLAILQGSQPAIWPGLQHLSHLVANRTTIPLGEPQIVAAESQQLLFHPLVYWAPSLADHPLDAAKVQALNAYMRSGGLLIIDGQGWSDPLLTVARLAPGLESPSLRPLTEDHVLLRSYYLLRNYPQIMAPAQSWLADPAAESDGVTALILTNAGWAAAWAAGNDRSMEMRLGVNLVIYSLTGTYKADQVHLPALMERLGR